MTYEDRVNARKIVTKLVFLYDRTRVAKLLGITKHNVTTAMNMTTYLTSRSYSYCAPERVIKIVLDWYKETGGMVLPS